MNGVQLQTITLASVAGVTSGDMLYQSEAVKSLIDEVDSEAGTVHVISTEAFTAAAAEVLVAYECSGKSSHLAPLGPGIEKDFRAAHFHFRKLYAHDFRATFDSEKSGVETEAVLTEEGFGLTAFGATPFGSPINLRNRKAGVDRKHARSTHIRVGFTIREARALWAIHGVSLDYEPVGPGSSR